MSKKKSFKGKSIKRNVNLRGNPKTPILRCNGDLFLPVAGGSTFPTWLLNTRVCRSCHYCRGSVIYSTCILCVNRVCTLVYSNTSSDRNRQHWIIKFKKISFGHNVKQLPTPFMKVPGLSLKFSPLFLSGWQIPVLRIQPIILWYRYREIMSVYTTVQPSIGQF
jgi:hypothetical protein